MPKDNLLGEIDTKRLLVLMESFYRLTGIPSTMLDLEGNPLKTDSGEELTIGWQRIFAEFHRQHPKTLERCKESDSLVAKCIESGERYTCYQCLNGLVDVASPVMVEGEHVWSLFTGQFFFEAPDREVFRRQAAEFGFDEDDYLAALDEVPVIPREDVEEAMVFLANLAELIGELALDQRRLREGNRLIEREVRERTRELHEANRALEEAKEKAEEEAAKRLHLETRARKSSLHLRNVLESTTDAFFELAPDFTVIYLNEKAEKILRCDREDIVGKKLLDAFPEAIGSRFASEYRRAMDEQTVVEFEEHYPPLDVWVEVHAYPTPASLSVYFRDITDRKRSEEALMEYHRLIESSDDIFMVLNRDFTYRLVNQAFLRRRNPKRRNLTREEVIGHTIREVLGEKMCLLIRPLVERCFQGETIEKEMTFDHEDESRVLLTRYYPILDESGRVSLVAGIIRDITNLRKAERELESFFNLSRDMMCVAGFDGTFKRINPAWESTLGWTEETFLKTPWIEFVHPDDIQPTLNAGEKLVDGKEIISFENRYRCRDGTYRWLSWNSRPVQKQGLIYAVVRDITSAKETEAALRERDRLQGTLETAGAVCHELNQPLQAITGYTDLLLLDIADRESSTEKARKIQEAVKLIGGITRKLAGITRYQTMDYIQGKIIDIDRASEKAPSKDPSSN